MKKGILTALLSIFFISTFGQMPKGYYDSAVGKTGYELKTALFNIIKNPNVTSYSGLWTAFLKTDIDRYYENDGTILDIYSENPSTSDPYNFTPISDQCGSYTQESICYNREHSFPKSWFNDASPMYSDLFHMYPTDGWVNNKRGNYPYGEVENANWTSLNGCELGPCSVPGYSGTVFEPINEFKGDLARTYFYMATCYEDRIDTWSSVILDGSTDQCYVNWFLNMLIQWNEQDPVSQKEIDRNDSIFKIQGNRNPYIDHPEWVECVWLGSCGNTVNPPINFSATGISTTEIDLSWNLNTSNDSVLLAYNTTNTFGTPSGSYTTGQTISGGGTVLYVGTNTDFNHTDLSSQNYYYKIWSLESTDYSAGVSTYASPFLPEPSNNVTNFNVSATSSSTIKLTWTDATGTTLPTAYLVKADFTGNTIIPPVDGIQDIDGTYQKNIAYGTQNVTFDGLNANTSYDFKIFPYTNSGVNIDFKTDGTIPFTTGTTDSVPAAGDTCGYETFDNIPSSNSQGYETRNWTGNDGITWTATDARTDQTINGKAICVRNGYLESGNITGGITSVTFSTQRVYTGDTGVISIYVNDSLVGTIPYSDVLHTDSIENINYSGDFILKLVTPGTGDRVVIDDLIWTCSNCTEPTIADYVTATDTLLCEGENTTLSYSGGSGDVFNWYSQACGGILVGVGNNLTVQPTTTTTYYGRWENSCYTTPCKSVTITVNPITDIITQPSNQSVVVGGTAIFTVSVIGGGLEYQWNKDGSTLTGENSDTLIINNVSFSDSGSYSCDITGLCGNVSSSSAILTVNQTSLYDFENNIIIYPNPNKGKFTIDLPNDKETTITIYNINGQNLYSEILNQNINIISIDGIKSGFYLIKFENKSEVYFSKLIIKK